MPNKAGFVIASCVAVAALTGCANTPNQQGEVKISPTTVACADSSSDNLCNYTEGGPDTKMQDLADSLDLNVFYTPTSEMQAQKWDGIAAYGPSCVLAINVFDVDDGNGQFSLALFPRYEEVTLDNIIGENPHATILDVQRFLASNAEACR